MFKNFIKDLRKKPFAVWLMSVLVLMMLGDVFLIKKTSDFILAFLSISWFLVNKHFKIDARVTVVTGISFLFFCPLFMSFNGALAEKFGIWAFLLFLSGTILLFKENEGKQQE